MIMEQSFITGIKINSVRHLNNISIPLDRNKRKHLVLTGKNGSGKTSTLEAIVNYIQGFLGEKGTSLDHAEKMYEFALDKYNKFNPPDDSEANRQRKYELENSLKLWEEQLRRLNVGVKLEFTSNIDIKQKYDKGKYIFAYYKATREFQIEGYNNIEKVDLKEKYKIVENPGVKLAKYLVDLKAVQAFSKDEDKIKKIESWFSRFETILRDIFDDKDLKLFFNDETFQFSIHETGREPFDFNTMSSGYSAVFDIINDLIMRMEAQSKLRTDFDMEGIVLVDEIETHLHLELQKKILPILITLFPNIQFIVSTHSPFILSSIDNAVIYDLENRILVKNGLGELPYEGIVEGYFKVDTLSEDLRNKYERYKTLVSKSDLTDEEYEEIDQLEYYLDEVPDYLANEITAEYSRLKLEFSNKD